MTPLTSINARNWQLALGQPGDVVSDLDDISQCIRVILTTPKRTDPLRPEFACDLWPYIDRPIDQAIPHIVEGKDLTYDVFRDNGDPEWEKKAVSTLDMARAVARKILPDYDKFDAEISAKAKEMCAWEHLPQ